MSGAQFLSATRLTLRTSFTLGATRFPSKFALEKDLLIPVHSTGRAQNGQVVDNDKCDRSHGCYGRR